VTVGHLAYARCPKEYPVLGSAEQNPMCRVLVSMS